MGSSVTVDVAVKELANGEGYHVELIARIQRSSVSLLWVLHQATTSGLSNSLTVLSVGSMSFFLDRE
jgi:hypothetical protein